MTLALFLKKNYICDELPPFFFFMAPESSGLMRIVFVF